MRLCESKTYKSDIERILRSIDISMLDGKTIFITGGLGLICSAIVDLLSAYGKTGTIYVGARNFLQFNDRYYGIKNIEYVDYEALKELSLDFMPDYVIHGAGLASPELYSSKPVETMLSNLKGVNSLLEYSRNSCVKRLLYLSSSEIYGKKRLEGALREDVYGEIDINSIRSSYAIAKKSSEMLCKSYSVEYGVDVVIVRPGHIFGPSAKTTDRRISSEFAYLAAHGKKLEMKSSGLQKRSYCYSLDCAAQILTVLLKGVRGESYNVGHDETMTIREMAETIANAGNVELTIGVPTEEEIKSFNPMDDSSLNNDRVKNLGYRDSFSVKEGLVHTVEILREIM